METTLDILDWNELTKFRNSDEFAAWRLDIDQEPAWLLSGEAAGWECDAGSMYFQISDALKKVVQKLPRKQRELLKNSLLILFAANEGDAVQDFPCSTESCYFLALSPETVAKITTNLSGLDLPHLAELLASDVAEPEDDEESEDDEDENRFTNFWRRMARRTTRLIPGFGRKRNRRGNPNKDLQETEGLKGEIEAYLQQAVSVANNAHQRGWGVIGHCG